MLSYKFYFKSTVDTDANIFFFDARLLVESLNARYTSLWAKQNIGYNLDLASNENMFTVIDLVSAGDITCHPVMLTELDSTCFFIFIAIPVV